MKPKVRARNGRPTKATPDRVALLIRCLEQGMTRRASCALAGIAEQTFHNWLAQGNGFLEAVQKAEATFEHDMVAGIRTEPKGKMWLLERRLRKDWEPPKQQLEVESKRPLTVRFVDYKDGIVAPEAEGGSGPDSPAPSQEEVAGGGEAVG